LKADQPKKHILLEEALTALDGSREDQLIALETDSEIATRLNHAIDRLTSRQKLILRLHYYEGLSYAQIAERLSMNYQSVNNLAFRTIRQLRSVMACFLFF
jgi:RNA polymerase sigma-70 factor (ECF subfamily)